MESLLFDLGVKYNLSNNKIKIIKIVITINLKFLLIDKFIFSFGLKEDI